MKIWLSALRVRQWNKQVLVTLPLIALGDEVQVSDLGKLFVIAIAFSLVASSIYIFNDLQDLASDRLDAVKSQRPFASGQISPLRGGGNRNISSLIRLLSGTYNSRCNR